MLLATITATGPAAAERDTSERVGHVPVGESTLAQAIPSAAVPMQGYTDGDASGTPAEDLVPPDGFTATLWAAVHAPATLEWGPDGRLYVMTFTGQVLVFDPTPSGLGVAVPFYELPAPATSIGIATDPDQPGLVYVSEWYSDDDASWGRIWSIADTTEDGRGDTRELVVDRLPAGQHFVQDLGINPLDGRLYFTNGSLTDNGLDCATPDERAWTAVNVEGGCPSEEVAWSGALLRVDRDARGLTPGDEGLELVSGGLRNAYGFAFWPSDPSLAYLPENGPSDPYGDDALRVTDVHDGNVDDHGFPSCLINPIERGNPFEEMLSGIVGDRPYDNTQVLKPQQSPNEDVIDLYGPCDPDEAAWPVALFEPHAAVTGTEFAHGSGFPGTYGNDLFVAQSGSHDFAAPTGGHDIVRVNFRDDGSIVGGDDGLPQVEQFATGGTPVDLTFGPDGAMYVADLNVGVIRIAWTGGAEPPDDEGGGNEHRCPPHHGDGDERPGKGHGPPCDDDHPGTGTDGDGSTAPPGSQLPATGGGIPAALALLLLASTMAARLSRHQPES